MNTEQKIDVAAQTLNRHLKLIEQVELKALLFLPTVGVFLCFIFADLKGFKPWEFLKLRIANHFDHFFIGSYKAFDSFIFCASSVLVLVGLGYLLWALMLKRKTQYSTVMFSGTELDGFTIDEYEAGLNKTTKEEWYEALLEQISVSATLYKAKCKAWNNGVRCAVVGLIGLFYFIVHAVPSYY